MHLWTIDNWKKFLIPDCRTGLYLRFAPEVDDEVKLALKKFARWLRKEYYFPLRIPVYVKSELYLKTLDGTKAVGTFFEPSDYSVEPYIRLATGDYQFLKCSCGRDDALASILLSFSHELTHYYQWINGIHLTPIGTERQATRYSYFILDEYSSVCEHP